ncbi:hypothetical protein RhiirA5_432163 [Rhizophagus irregularis]|uniref:Uncharacterized protein n=1 Tax=Rhizophagus irregularis TaxID=588596 RepID=A0A2I1FDS8_9GLOM|nr:hypothetical protein RhiirA5_432163 [Rhizophagus irregularis]PKC55721.1 hypothetical protein RhiirA1_475136 [Rhizophagus irregularis]PKY32534.1 hypothetical protein RhiirB3_532115 [Rhizophagus irregularis]
MANNPETLAQLYGLFLYRKKDIIAIQEKLGIGGNTNQLAVPPDFELMGKTLADSYELLLELVGDLILIQENLNIDEDDIIAIQEELCIVGYSNQERAEEADKTAKEYF